MFKQKEKNRRFRKRFVLVIFLPVILIVGFGFSIPNPLFNTSYSTVLESSDGQLLGARIAADEQWRFPLVDSVPGKYEK